MNQGKGRRLLLSVPINLWRALKYFLRENGIDKSSILAYYSIFSSFFLLIFFSFLFIRLMGNPDNALKNMYPFTPDFFRKISPVLVEKATALSATLESFSLPAIAIFVFLGVLIFRKIIRFVNDMFHIEIKKGFFFKRLQEFALLMIVGILLCISFLLTGFISTVTTIFYENPKLAPYIHPAFVRSLDNFLIRYLVPFLITFVLFLIVFHWIPEKKVGGRSALIAALISAVLWETVKRVYTYYLINVSLIGKIEGPIIAIIMFGFWMEVSMGIMLYGAKLTYLLDKGGE
jgi:membrane protein